MPNSKIPMHNSYQLERRTFLAGGIALLAVSSPLRAVAALTRQQATGLIGQLVNDLNAIINSGKPEKAMYKDFENLLRKYADLNIIARSSLGAAWRQATPSQRKRYTEAFISYLAAKYGKRFREFIGGKIVVTDTRKVKSGYLVNSTAYLPGQAPFAVDWQVSDRSGKNKMFNLYIEGISLLATERTEIGSMLDRRHGNIEKLIVDLKKLG
ncbi:MAG: ABC transporter substrate-binding protein [Paracoccaceae bacterium]|nr:ABC transporter substrate-binding protein [Paracoccaceae bacterium]